jgi:heptosyltransferase-3
MKRILIISLSNIGDAVMTTPVLQYLHKTHKNFNFDIVCDLKSIEIFKSCPYVNNIYIKNKQEGLFGILKLIKILRKTKYEMAIDLRTDLMLYFIKAKIKYFKFNDKEIHSVIKHFYALKEDLDKLPDTKVWIPRSSLINAKKLLNKSKKIIALGIGSNAAHKLWPVENYLKLIELLRNRFDTCVLLGDKRDYELATKFVKKSKIKTFNFCGSLSLMDSSAILSYADYFIGNDSGLGHIASALKIPSFTIFGRENPKRYHPWGKKAQWYQHPDKNILSIKPQLIYKKIIPSL